jgi:hypothetical protein
MKSDMSRFEEELEALHDIAKILDLEIKDLIVSTKP